MLKIFRLVVALSIMMFAVASASAQLSGVDGKAQFIKVTDRVYCATGYALGNVILVITDKSAVVIDTTESMQSARRALEEFRKISQLPISYIIYTHHLNPGSSSAFTRALIEAAGGSAPLVKRARQAMRDGHLQLVLDLTGVILGADQANREAHAVRAEALEKLGGMAVNGIERNIYLAAAAQHKKAAGK